MVVQKVHLTDPTTLSVNRIPESVKASFDLDTTPKLSTLQSSFKGAGILMLRASQCHNISDSST